MSPRNWVEISRGALRRNLSYVRSRVAAGTAVCAVVKADAYGHGAVACAQVFTAADAAARRSDSAEWLAVTSAEEGARLRGAGADARILVLAGFAPEEAEALIEHRLTPAVWDVEQIAWLAAALPAAAARRSDSGATPPRLPLLPPRGASASGTPGVGPPSSPPPDEGRSGSDVGHFSPATGRDLVDNPAPRPAFSLRSEATRTLPLGAQFPIHLKLESGMGRLGITPSQEAAVMAALRREPRLQVEAVFSHLAASESTDATGSHEQYAQFRAAAERLGQAHTGWHLLNSEGALRYPQWGGMLVRAGLALYGYSAQPEHAAQLTPALSWKTRVIAIKDLPAGHGIGYGAQFRAPRAMRVATIAVGYADGYRRDFWPGGRVLIGGAPAPVVGAVSMDLTTVDVSHLPATQIGDAVVLLGGAVSAVELAALAGTIPYEILCGLSARVQRIYLEAEP